RRNASQAASRSSGLVIECLVAGEGRSETWRWLPLVPGFSVGLLHADVVIRIVDTRAKSAAVAALDVVPVLSIAGLADRELGFTAAEGARQEFHGHVRWPSFGCLGLRGWPAAVRAAASSALACEDTRPDIDQLSSS